VYGWRSDNVACRGKGPNSRSRQGYGYVRYIQVSGFLLYLAGIQRLPTPALSFALQSQILLTALWCRRIWRDKTIVYMRRTKFFCFGSRNERCDTECEQNRAR
jgi:hypothetical protein